MGTVTVSPAPGGTFCHAPLSPTAVQIVQPDPACGKKDEQTEKYLRKKGEGVMGLERKLVASRGLEDNPAPSFFYEKGQGTLEGKRKEGIRLIQGWW